MKLPPATLALPKSIAFLDTETTGLNPKRDRIIEIGILRVEDGEIVRKLDTVIHPRQHVPPEIYYLTGIREEEILRAPDFEEVKNNIGEILDGAIFTAHNARFDYAFLKHEFGRFGDPFQSKILCTVKLVRKLFPKVKSYKLEALINYFGINPKARHRAFADAEVLWQLYKIALDNHGEDKVSEVITSIMKMSSLPSNLPREIVDSLPESSGIYTFYGEDSTLPLYVGKSINIKDRVKAHFSQDHKNTTDLTMSSQIKLINAIPTAGEIGALVRESDMIKNTMPVYNKQLRRRRDLWVALAAKTGEYNSLNLSNLQELENSEALNILAVFKSRKNAKESLYNLSREYSLCPRLLGIENGKGRCFASQIGICRGACTKEEDSVDYNIRFNEAFKKTRVIRWPFKSKIVIKEENVNGLTELHYIDNWLYLGSVTYSINSIDEPKIEKYTPRFDWDIYKILAKAVLLNKNVHAMAKEEEEMFFTR